MLKKLLNIRSVSDLKGDLIKQAHETKRQHVRPDGHVDAGALAHQVAQWVTLNKQPLEYKGPSHADAKHDYEEAGRAYKAAKEKEAAAHVAVLKECGGLAGAESRTHAGVHPFEAKLEGAYKQAQRDAEAARREELEALHTMHTAAQHERAKAGAALILAQILGAE